MNAEMRMKLGLDIEHAIGCQFEDLLTVGSKILYQTHFYPLIKMQKSAREIYLVFKGHNGPLPVLLNVKVKQTGQNKDMICGAMEIANRNRYEKELINAKKAAEEALTENAELKKVKKTLVKHQELLESQFRKLKSLKEQQQEVFKLIAHDLQEPLRKTIFNTNYILSKNNGLPKEVVKKLWKIINFSSQMREMLLTLLHFKELEDTQLVYSKIDLSDLIRNTLKELNIVNNNHFSIDYPEKSPEFFADNRMITRLFKELFKNSRNNRNLENEALIIKISAIETVKNSYFEVSDKYKYDKFLRITYEDNSLGFKSKEFEIIQKSEEFNTINIGLAFGKEIVEKHLGAISVKYVRGQGNFYTIYLPIKQPIQRL